MLNKSDTKKRKKKQKENLACEHFTQKITQKT